MNNINLHNYEAFLLDAIEGRLTAEQQLDLDLFMALHPELAIDLENIAEANVIPEQALFTDKAGLKKIEADLVSPNHFIAYIEGQLTDTEIQEIEKSCAANPLLAKELELYRNTIAVADNRIVYEGKAQLKRQPKVIFLYSKAAQFAAAASVAFLILLYVLWPTKTADMIQNTFAQKDIRKHTGHSSDNNIINSTASSFNNQGNNTIAVSQVKHISSHESIAQKTMQGTNTTTTLTSVVPDSASHMASAKKQEPVMQKEPVLVASASQKTVVQVITEQDDEPAVATEKKQGFWALAGKTLKGLNKAGVKTVNGEEETTKSNETYALTLGGLSITHKSH